MSYKGYRVILFKLVLIIGFFLFLWGCRNTSSLEQSTATRKELIGDLVHVRILDKHLTHEKIEAGKEYLLRTMHPTKYGFYKKYDALKNKAEKRLRTIYSASSLYTFLKISDLDQDPRVIQAIPHIADFLLSMQVKENERKGAFYYSYYLKTDQKEPAFVVGTAAKTIFTLLELYRRKQDQKYLETAKAAGDWLLRMRNPDGSIINYVKYINNQWVYGKKFSCLYTGQVLSAFSRLYRTTLDERYYDAALQLARGFASKAQTDSYFAKDEYRSSADPIPTSWMVMSLLDFYKINKEIFAKEAMLKLAEELLKQQMKDPKDILNFGRFEGTEATSGNGWITEVMTEFYRVCKEEKWSNCEKYKKTVILTIRWLIQNTYSKENTFFLKQPESAIGGLIRNPYEENVRTDAVCHWMNGYMNIYDDLDDSVLVDVN